MGGSDRLDVACFVELKTVDADLTMEAAVGMWIVVTMIDDVVFLFTLVVDLLEHRMMPGAMDRAVGIGLQDGSLVFVGTHGRGRCGILHVIGLVVARLARIHEIIDSIALQDKRCLEEVLCLGVGNKTRLGEGLQVLRCLADTTTEAFVDAPGSPIDIHFAIVIDESLSVERNGTRHIAVVHPDGLTLVVELLAERHALRATDGHRLGVAVRLEQVVPGTYGRFGLTDIEVAGLAIDHIILSIGVLHHIGCPDPMACGPVHREKGPVLEVLARPALGRAKACATAIGGGIEIIGVAKLPDGRIGEIAGNERIAGTRSVECDRNLSHG